MTVIFRWFFFVTFPSLKSNFFLCLQLMMILIKVSDISNEARPMEVAEPWLDCLLQEFYNQVWSAVLACVRNRCWDQSGVYEILTYTTVRAQSRSKVFKIKNHVLLFDLCPQSDAEKLEGLPVTPFMDPEKITKPSSQTGFIGFVLLPLFIELANLFPCLEVSHPQTSPEPMGFHYPRKKL